MRYHTVSMLHTDNITLSNRFRGFLPVVVDVETAGFNCETDALLEIAAVIIGMDSEARLFCEEVLCFNVLPFEGANLEASSLAFTKIDPFSPLREAIDEESAIRALFRAVRKAVHRAHCNRAILVGHNSNFDLSFIKSACERTGVGNNPFHPFSTFDTVSLAGLAYGHTVLSKAMKLAGLEWDESQAHSAQYDAEKTAELFCTIVNNQQSLNNY